MPNKKTLNFGIMKYARKKFRVPSPYYKCKLVEVYEIHPKLDTNLELEKYLNIWLTGWIFENRALWFWFNDWNICIVWVILQLRLFMNCVCAKATPDVMDVLNGIFVLTVLFLWFSRLLCLQQDGCLKDLLCIMFPSEWHGSF